MLEIKDAPRPVPNDPPRSYEEVGARAIFYRTVSNEEVADLRSSGMFRAQRGGIDDGKFLTTTAELARNWATLFVTEGVERQLGNIIRISVSESVASEIYFVGSRVDGIGACYFASLGQLADAEIEEVTW